MMEDKKVELVFPGSESIDPDRVVKRGPTGKIVQQFSASVEQIKGWFSDYKVESIEIWISGGFETEGIIKLAVSAKGEGGLKFTLKPKTAT